MRPNLILQPIHNSSTDILKCFANGKPLSSDQTHFLEWHQKQLSGAEFDPVLKYYLQLNKSHPHKYQGTFLLPHEIINFEAIKKLKERIQLFLKQKAKNVSISLNQKQFQQFIEIGTKELIFWHGNQFLTGAPMFPGGTPPVIFFQWGNFFGIVKYLVLAGEKALKANLLIYFEDMQDRNLDQCVIEYNHRLTLEVEQQNTLLMQHDLNPEEHQHFLIKQAHI